MGVTARVLNEPCDRCGGPTYESACKISCLSCGARRDCSDVVTSSPAGQPASQAREQASEQEGSQDALVAGRPEVDVVEDGDVGYSAS